MCFSADDGKPLHQMQQHINFLIDGCNIIHTHVHVYAMLDVSNVQPPIPTANFVTSGMVCPAETPEGQACGLVKNLSLMAYITVGSGSSPVLEFLEEFGMENLEEILPSAIPEATKVCVVADPCEQSMLMALACEVDVKLY